jgi:hypothetical protein
MSRAPGHIPWPEDEPGWQDFKLEVRRLYRRNRARPLPLLLFVLCTTAFGLYRGYQYKPTYTARIALRLSEQDVGISVAPRPISALKGFVTDVALSDRVLMRLIERFDLYPNLRRRGMDQALESLRDDIGVEVWRNEFLLEEDPDRVGRAARVALQYTHLDPDVAWGVVQGLAEATVAEQRAAQRVQVQYLALGLEPALTKAREEVAELKRKLGRPQAPLAQRLAWLDELQAAERTLKELSDSRQQAQLWLRAETLNLGLRTDIIDSVRPTRRPLHGGARILGALLGLVFGLLLGGVSLRTFDRRVYDEEDLRRLGYAVCGSLPAFPGDGIGSMKTRVRMSG